MSDTIIRRYYECFNSRLLGEAAELLAQDLEFEHPFVGSALGRHAYIETARRWIAAFPDVRFDIEGIIERGDTIIEVSAVARGGHAGLLDLGVQGALEPTGARIELPFTELLEVRVGRVTFSRVTFDMPLLIKQLTIEGAAGSP